MQYACVQYTYMFLGTSAAANFDRFATQLVQRIRKPTIL